MMNQIKNIYILKNKIKEIKFIFKQIILYFGKIFHGYRFGYIFGNLKRIFSFTTQKIQNTLPFNRNRNLKHLR